jgi:hypothetical protein
MTHSGVRSKPPFRRKAKGGLVHRGADYTRIRVSRKEQFPITRLAMLDSRLSKKRGVRPPVRSVRYNGNSESAIGWSFWQNWMSASSLRFNFRGLFNSSRVAGR